MPELTYRFVQAGAVRLHAVEAGPTGGSPVILLHGFPDAAFGWQKQIDALAAAGFRVVAPDQRGYALSDKPRGAAAYRQALLAADCVALAEALGFGQFNLAGHDFGALVAWRLAAEYPERVRRLAILNVPHPAVLRDYQMKSGEQRLKSWYAYAFQLPVLPEILLRASNWKPLSDNMCRSLSAADLDRYRAAWSQPGAMTAMINWYRAMPGTLMSDRQVGRIAAPTLMIWGKQDLALMWQMAPDSIAYCEQGRLEMIEDATHWVHQDKPEAVNRLLLEHFSEDSPLQTGGR